MRTVPNDKHQTAAMVQFIKHHGWNWVGMVISDGDYGRSALEHFADQAAKSGICLAFKSILPSTGTDEDLRSAFRTAVQTIYQHPKAQVIVSFSKWSHMKDIYQEMRNEVLRKGESMESMRRVWLASDSWSMASNVQGDLSLADIGQVVGFNFKTRKVSSFSEYLDRLEATGSNNTWMNTFLQEFTMLMNTSDRFGNASLASHVVKTIKDNMNPATVLSVELAVAAIAQAVASLCRSRDCKTPGNLQPWEVQSMLLTYRTNIEEQPHTHL